MLAEIPLMFGGFDDRMDEYQVQAIVHSLEKVEAVFENIGENEPDPYDYMTTKEFLYKTYTRVPRLMIKHRTNPLSPVKLWLLLPFVVEEAVQDNLEYSKTLRQSEG